jgi:uncharacterized glyoxalase superfamily protein PhnB
VVGTAYPAKVLFLAHGGQSLGHECNGAHQTGARATRIAPSAAKTLYSLNMLKNRSVPADILLPHITYQSVTDALVWLTKTFGFVEHYRYGEWNGSVQGAQMHLGEAWIMINSARPGSASPAQAGHGTQSITIFVDDVDAHCERTKSAGARIVEDLHETEYGERQYGVEDLEGHHWLFSRHARNVSPEEWGAIVNQALDLKEVVGHTEWKWTPRSYTVETDQGAVTGTQAIIDFEDI